MIIQEFSMHLKWGLAWRNLIIAFQCCLSSGEKDMTNSGLNRDLTLTSAMQVAAIRSTAPSWPDSSTGRALHWHCWGQGLNPCSGLSHCPSKPCMHVACMHHAWKCFCMLACMQKHFHAIACNFVVPISCNCNDHIHSYSCCMSECFLNDHQGFLMLSG